MKEKKAYCSPECHREELKMQNLLCVSGVETLMIVSWLEDDTISPLFP